MLELKLFPIRYELLNELYEQTDQTYCLNPLTTPLDETLSRNYFLAMRTEQNQGRPFMCRGVFLNGTLIGKIELTREQDDAELDLIMRTDHCGKGYGTEALEQLIADVKEAGRCKTISAYADRDNIAVRNVLLKNRFAEERSFQADVVGFKQGQYILRMVQGMEYRRVIES